MVGNPGGGATFFASIRNTGFLAASPTRATIRFQPLTRFTPLGGRTYYIDMPGSTPIATTGTVGRISANTTATLSTSSARTPNGLNRITVCADSSAAVAEISESNNCFTEVKDVTPIYFG